MFLRKATESNHVCLLHSAGSWAQHICRFRLLLFLRPPSRDSFLMNSNVSYNDHPRCNGWLAFELASCVALSSDR